MTWDSYIRYSFFLFFFFSCNILHDKIEKKEDIQETAQIEYNSMFWKKQFCLFVCVEVLRSSQPNWGHVERGPFA